MSEGPIASYDVPQAAGKIATPVDGPPTDDPRFDVDLVMDRALAANEMAHDAAVAQARVDVEQVVARVVAASGVPIPVATGDAQDFMVNPIDVARALGEVGLLCVSPADPVSVIAAELADVASRRGAVILDAMARIVTRPPTVDVLTEVYDILSGFAGRPRPARRDRPAGGRQGPH